jgi:metal-responsive CopG/Arc/MetJ family transcriptional regulator
MARTIIDIPEAQLREVDKLCKLLGISRAEAVRRALLDFVHRNEDVKTDGFGLWAQPSSEAKASSKKLPSTR